MMYFFFYYNRIKKGQSLGKKCHPKTMMRRKVCKDQRYKHIIREGQEGEESDENEWNEEVSGMKDHLDRLRG